MRYRVLGGTGIEVSVHCLGSMMFGAVGNPDHDDCARIIHHALDQGINFIDTADEESLRRLRTDWIDLYQVHRPDHTTDIEETLDVLGDLVGQGKIRAFGCSTFPAEDIVEAHHVAERRGLRRFRTEQPPYSLIARASRPTSSRCASGTAWAS
nr:aldo/keto reductase [Nonomuraea diastatica]